jgi:hypothetical protein
MRPLSFYRQFTEKLEGIFKKEGIFISKRKPGYIHYKEKIL